MGKDGITAITLTTDQGSTTVTPEAFDRYVASLKGGRPMVSATATAVSIRVPTEEDFFGADFMEDAALTTLFWDVVQSYRRLRDVIAEHDISVSVLWKRKGGKKQGAPTFAKCQKPSGLLGHFCTSQFVIWVGADNLAEWEWTTDQIRKLLYHEARHIGWDDGDEEHEAKPIILGHDVELFSGEVEDTGAWEHFRQVLATDFKQAGLLAS